MTHDDHSSAPADMAPDTDGAEAGAADAQPRPPQPAASSREALRRPAPKPAGAEKLQPGWVLSASGEHLTRDELLARYRRQRGLPEDPFEGDARPVPPAGYRDRIMTAPQPTRFAQRSAAADATPPHQPRTFTLGQTLAISAAMALVAGGAAGVLSARLPELLGGRPALPFVAAAKAVAAPSPAAVPAAPAGQLQLAEAPAARDTVIDKKPVSTATLQVADVTGETNSFIPLALHAEPAGLHTDMLLKISGVPEDAYLTSGRRQQDNVWALSLAEIRNVKLVVPQADDPQIDLTVAAFESGTGELAAPVKTMTVALRDVVVQPVSAPPPGSVTAGPVPIPPPDSVKLTLAVPETAETQGLITSADALLARGDVGGARKSYARAWGNDGSAAAAFGMARSHDPLVLAAIAGSNAAPDLGEALRWYQRAAAAGNPEATKAIIRLQMKP